MNFRVNARAHRLPACPECNAYNSEPCTSDRGEVRAPHRVRERIANGELLVATEAQAREVKGFGEFEKLKAKLGLARAR